MKLIALCGAPGAGKTEIQKYLTERFEVAANDDGLPMRDFAMRHLGLSEEDVYTAHGKARTVTLPGGEVWTVRNVLGDLGLKLTELFGPDVIPAMGYRQAMKLSGKVLAVSFGSVRQSQARFFKSRGAKVIEVIRPGCVAQNDFDRYDRSYIDVTLYNDGTVEDLHREIDVVLGPWLGGYVMP